jgi:hypothetical protein
VDYIFTYPEAIAYFGYSYYYENRESLRSVPVKNSEGNFVEPDQQTIGDGTYNPLARRIYMNLLNSAESLKDTVSYVEFGLDYPELVSVTGYVPIPREQIEETISTLTQFYGGSLYGSDNDAGGLSGGAIAGIVVGSLVGVCLIVLVIARCKVKRDGKFVVPK